MREAVNTLGRYLLMRVQINMSFLVSIFWIYWKLIMKTRDLELGRFQWPRRLCASSRFASRRLLYCPSARVPLARSTKTQFRCAGSKQPGCPRFTTCSAADLIASEISVNCREINLIAFERGRLRGWGGGVCVGGVFNCISLT